MRLSAYFNTSENWVHHDTEDCVYRCRFPQSPVSLYVDLSSVPGETDRRTDG